MGLHCQTTSSQNSPVRTMPTRNHDMFASADENPSSRHMLKVGIPCRTIRIRKEWGEPGETITRTISRQHIGGVTKGRDLRECAELWPISRFRLASGLSPLTVIQGTPAPSSAAGSMLSLDHEFRQTSRLALSRIRQSSSERVDGVTAANGLLAISLLGPIRLCIDDLRRRTDRARLALCAPVMLSAGS
jgi:hypothetical protein